MIITGSISVRFDSNSIRSKGRITFVSILYILPPPVKQKIKKVENLLTVFLFYFLCGASGTVVLWWMLWFRLVWWRFAFERPARARWFRRSFVLGRYTLVWETYFPPLLSNQLSLLYLALTSFFLLLSSAIVCCLLSSSSFLCCCCLWCAFFFPRSSVCV